MIFGGIEAGGTKFVCGVGNQRGEVLDRVVITTRQPQETIAEIVDFFKDKQSQYEILGIGLASFGPLDLNPQSPTFGYITSSPKKRWRQYNIKGELESALGFSIPFDTDVNAAALAEYKWGAAIEKENVIYITVGTGIGGGGLINGQMLHGLLHPEMGHMRLRGNGISSDFVGICPFHDNCLEGLASGPAIQSRWGIPAEELPNDHPAWEIEAKYLAEGISNIILIFSPDIIILGGGVMEQKNLFPMIHKNVLELLNSYIQKDEITENIVEYIVPAKLGKNAGLLGAVALALEHGGR